MAMNPATQSSVDAAEVHQFSQIAACWWDERGPFRPLHRMNPVRIGYVRDRAAAHFGRDTTLTPLFTGLTLADIGCGGGLLCEPMARLGFDVTGVDASPQNIAVAQTHAQQSGLAIRYRAATAEALAEEGASFDAVLALEIIEHVADVSFFMEALAALVKPGGLLCVSTLNRTMKSLLMAKIGAEYVLRMLPRGTHDWRKFLLPHEVETLAAAHGLHVVDVCGMTYHPVHGRFALDAQDLGVNYLMTFIRPPAA